MMSLGSLSRLTMPFEISTGTTITSRPVISRCMAISSRVRVTASARTAAGASSRTSSTRTSRKPLQRRTLSATGRRFPIQAA